MYHPKREPQIAHILPCSVLLKIDAPQFRIFIYFFFHLFIWFKEKDNKYRLIVNFAPVPPPMHRYVFVQYGSFCVYELVCMCLPASRMKVGERRRLTQRIALAREILFRIDMTCTIKP